MDGSRIRREKVADSKISGYVWTGPNLHSIRLMKSTAFDPGLKVCLEILKKVQDNLGKRFFDKCHQVLNK